MPHTATISNLLKGKSTRCNICAKKKHNEYRKKFLCYADAIADDETRRRLLNRLSAAISRCHKPTNRLFHNYGGRGIYVCQLWQEDKRAFLLHVREIKGFNDPKLEMDRIDNNKGYEPGNIQFVSKADNNRNRRKIADLQKRIDELERCLRHCTCGASKQIHD